MFKFWKKKSPVTDTEKFRAKQHEKIVKNIERMKYYFENGNIKGVSLQTRYLESVGISPPATIKQCDYLVERLRVERELLER